MRACREGVVADDVALEVGVLLVLVEQDLLERSDADQVVAEHAVALDAVGPAAEQQHAGAHRVGDVLRGAGAQPERGSLEVVEVVPEDVVVGDDVVLLRGRALAERAGVSLSSTTYHFASKEAIVDEALREVAARELARVERGLRELHALGPAAPEAFAGAIVDWLAEQLEGEGRLAVRGGYHLQLEAMERPALQPILVEWAIGVQTLAEEALRLAGSPHPRTDARILATAIDGLRLEQLTSPQPHFAERVGPVVERLLVALTARRRC